MTRLRGQDALRTAWRTPPVERDTACFRTGGLLAAFGSQEAVVVLLSGELFVGLGGWELELVEGDALYVSEGAQCARSTVIG
jgi:hypothetical protein